MKVAITDDHRVVREGIRYMLGDAPGVEVVGEAESGEEILALVASEPVDVVLLDVKMPGLGGLEVIRMIKARQPKLQVIMLTGHGSVVDAEQGMEAGAFAYLQKPVKIDVLVRTLLSATEAVEGGGE